MEEPERRSDGTIEQTLTLFLAGAECAFTCSFCDLWRYTIDGPTPPGALVSQVARVLETLDGPPPDRLKLYTASNFFDRRAVPPEDLAGLARLSAPYAAVTVESHASTIGEPTLAFARALEGRLEVAIGLETIHPVAMANQNKKLALSRFDRAAEFLRAHDIDVRVFVLLGAPYVPREEAVDWTVRTAAYAISRGASVVSLIPVRGGNGEMERLAALGAFTPPSLRQLENALDHCVPQPLCTVTADLWDVQRLPGCDSCRGARVERMRTMNLSGAPAPRIECAACESTSDTR